MTASNHAANDRFLLWIDAVGGYWVCLAEEVIVGQPAGGVDVPILGDLSERHAWLRRDGEAYLVEPLRPLRVNSQPVDGVTTLQDRARILLGDRVELRFRRPHPLSATARLEFRSGHRTQPSSDAVLLMAETCVLGPSRQSHVVCRAWPHEVVLYRRGGELFCRTAGSFQIDGRPVKRDGRVWTNSRIEGSGFSLSLEPI
ncbi:MAG: FHA domain-containing protein [Pirellulaceae bacterium]|nr:FHA domain-containing protein [Thermoguttaceae bacterium]MDI9442591.1 FHA domain-containing protein [Planctomycetota bacterium]NLZ01152.1 FHA domain-containing protein [Pirellulaceae bacterium]